MKQTLRVIKNELRSEKRVLPENKPKPLSPPKFEVELVDMHNPGLKWYFGLERMR